MTIPFYSGRKTAVADEPLLGPLIDEIVDLGVFSQGPQVRELERLIAAYVESAHAVAVNSATDGLAIGWRALGIGPGDEVLVPDYTFFATASSVALVGAKPVFVDVDPVTYAMDPSEIARRVTPRTRAVVPVHLFSQAADMPAIVSEADRFGLTVVEDSAEAIGMRIDGRHAGLFGPLGVISFFPTKTLGGYGDSGMIVTNDDEVAESCRRLRDHGRAPGEEIATIPLGTNCRMDEVQAAVLRVRLGHLDRDIARRARLAAYYDERLAGLAPHVSTPRFVRRPYQSNPVWYVYLVEVDRRDDLVDHLKARGIGTEVYYPTPLHLQPCFRPLGHRRGDFPVAESAASRALALPLYPDLTESQAEAVCEAVESFYTRSHGR